MGKFELETPSGVKTLRIKYDNLYLKALRRMQKKCSHLVIAEGWSWIDTVSHKRFDYCVDCGFLFPKELNGGNGHE